VTLAYYPDGRQEQLLQQHGLVEGCDLLHAMAYDQSPTPAEASHSSLSFGLKVADALRQLSRS